MTKIAEWFKLETNRAYVYRAVGAVGAVLMFYGVLGGEDLAVILAALSTLLTTGLAVGNTSTEISFDDDSTEFDSHSAPFNGRSA